MDVDAEVDVDVDVDVVGKCNPGGNDGRYVCFVRSCLLPAIGSLLGTLERGCGTVAPLLRPARKEGGGLKLGMFTASSGLLGWNITGVLQV